MKIYPILLSLLPILASSSCVHSDPEYQKYKKQKEEEEKAQRRALKDNPFGAPNLPEDSPGSDNPYGIPYQSLPALPNNTGTAERPLRINGGPTMQIPPAGAANPLGSVIEHRVVAGDTIWGLSRKYKVSQFDISVANNLNDNVIQIGQILKIPQQ